MIRTTRTLHGTRFAVLAIITAAAALAFDAGRAVCPHAPTQSALLTRTAQ